MNAATGDGALESESSDLSGAQVVRLPVKHKISATEVTPETGNASEVAPGDLVAAYERFQLLVQVDVESERELLYKSLLVVEILALAFALRELLIRSLL
jgi:hypothetical protein